MYYNENRYKERGEIMPGITKPFLPVDDQVKKLEERGLAIKNKEYAKRKLLQTTYYDLINGYKDMFLESRDDEEERYIEGTTFEDILELYELDRQLRYMTLELLLDIESKFYSSISYSVSYFYGESSNSYLNKHNYKIGKKQRVNNRYERDNLFMRLNNKITNPDVQPLIYYKTKYKNIPPWILVKDMTFGELKIFYKLSKKNVKDMIIKTIINKNNLTELDKQFFAKSIGIFNNFRNWCAHGGRIYNYKSKVKLPYYKKYHDIFNITQIDYNAGKGQNDVSALLIASLFFFQADYWGFIEFRVKLEGYLNDYKKLGYAQYQDLLDELGLPDNYSNQIDLTIGIASVEIPQG